MATHIRRSRRSRDSLFGPSLFRRPFKRDDADTAAAWETYLASGDAAALQQLFEHYAPLATIVAARLIRRQPELYASIPIEDLAAHASVELWETLNKAKYPHAFGSLAMKNMRARI